ncbi:fluoride efflux transporter FluC [Streptomyces sp. NBC_00859]|uniref:fluoride efflux transporter FluC n=1 Tax=Streptomyces sp. NBC_00859 TaxID=2903682 RepID=UPI00386B81BD|nr:CrcB family protein [Streptomyces sp. NBC_00859]
MPKTPVTTVGDIAGAGPDGGFHVPVQRDEPRPAVQGAVLAAVSAGGVAGASARYGASLLWPTADGAFPWTTYAVNTLGCALIGVLMVLVTEGRTPHRLVRPFFGTGVLGGFTTFSTYTVDIRRLAEDGHARTALGCLALTLFSALAAVGGSATLTRRLVTRRRR